MDAGPASKVKSISSDILEAISFPIAIPFSVYSFGIAVGRKDILRKIVAVATREECFEKKSLYLHVAFPLSLLARANVTSSCPYLLKCVGLKC